MKRINLEEFETLREQNVNNIVTIRDGETQKSYYILVNEEEKKLTDEEFIHFIEEEVPIKINKPDVHWYYYRG